MTTAIQVKNLSKGFRDFWGTKKKVLSEVSFDVPLGGVTGFIGANGSGKTTTLKCILDFLKPDAGHVTWFEGLQWSTEVQSRIGYMPERPYLPEFQTGLEYIQWQSQLAGAKLSRDQLMSYLEQVSLQDAALKTIHTYSKGMQQRLGLAQSLVESPDLLILDEPMSGLDPDGRLLVKKLLRRIRESGTTLFVTSHLLQDLQEMSENIVVLSAGKTLFSGRMDEIQMGAERFEVVYFNGASTVVETAIKSQLPKTLNEIQEKGHEIREIRAIETQLEEIYAKLIQKGLVA